MRRLIVACLCLVAPCLAVAAPQDDAAMRRYVLTLEKVRLYAAAKPKLSAVEHSLDEDSATAATAAGEVEGDGGESLPQALSRIKRSAALEGAIHESGLTDEDFVLLPMVLLSAEGAANLPPEQRADVPVSADSVAFVQAHRAEIYALMK